ncbi:ComF family protein [Halomonas cupida]|uniref:ComF family protein n=1 Tax=Halomonas cupida TaxID=44933 RepID=UPI003EF68E6F
MPLCRRCQACLAWNVAPCERCAEPLAPALEARPAGTRLCGRCLTAPLALDTVVAPLIYRDEIRRLVQRFKAGAHRPSAHQLTALFLWALEARETTVPDVLMGVPRHRQRAREQGFDQSEWLASELGRRLGLPVIRGQRRRNDPPQHTLTASARRRQVKGMFDVAGPMPRHVVLVDDVMTTGATLSRLASACRDAGAERVDAWVMARTPPPWLC